MNSAESAARVTFAPSAPRCCAQITPYFSVCYASPYVLSNVSSDPKSAAAADWWAAKVKEIYSVWGGGFGGFLVKADSEGNQGPQAFNATEADGANLLATALAPHGGIVMWRAFVYGGGTVGKEDRAKQAFDTFKPLDGAFLPNVVVQIKNGPMDFQVREPLSPLLLAALRHTSVMMEVQAAQEYTGQQIHAVNLVPQWESYLSTDSGRNATVAQLLSGTEGDATRMSGMAAVSNLGNFRNWTGHLLAASNIYGFGRLGWDPLQRSEDINLEWAAMTFGGGAVAETVRSHILQPSWEVYEGYTSPMGIGFVVEGGVAGGWCAPPTKGPGPGPDGAECPNSPLEPSRLQLGGTEGGVLSRQLGDSAGAGHYWLNPCSNYGYSNYSTDGIGCDRTTSGTGYADQYAPSLRTSYDDPLSCPPQVCYDPSGEDAPAEGQKVQAKLSHCVPLPSGVWLCTPP